MKLKALKGGLFLKNEDIFSKSFFTLIAPISLPHIQDIDGNVYTYVRIGNQEWVVENLRTTTYADGTPINNITESVPWMNDTTGAYCWYDNDIINKDSFGAIYNHFAVLNAHGLALDGWRIATYADYIALAAFGGGADIVGGKLKEVGTSHWADPNTGATNEYGFKAVPIGVRGYWGNFSSYDGSYCTWWVYDDLGAGMGYEISLNYNDTIIVIPVGSQFGYYGNGVRCVRDV